MSALAVKLRELASLDLPDLRKTWQQYYGSRRISLAFLAPDITELIMSGTQPFELTPERLKQACPLPVLWDEQRALLLA